MVTELFGNWRLMQVEGGITGVVTTVPPDSVLILKIQDNNTYESLYNGQLIDSGRYILTDTVINSDQTQSAIVFASGSPMVYRLNKDSLFLGLTVDDNLEQVYLKTN